MQCKKTFPKTTIRGNQKLENLEKLFGYANCKERFKTFPENTIRDNGFHQSWKNKLFRRRVLEEIKFLSKKLTNLEWFLDYVKHCSKSLPEI